MSTPQQGARSRANGTPQDSAEKRQPVSRKMEEAFEDIRIFEEWLHNSHHTTMRSRVLCQGIMGSIWLGIAWNVMRALYQISQEDYPAWTIWRLLVLTIPAQVGAFVLGCFYGTGAYQLRVDYAASRLQKLNKALYDFHISYCANTGRLRIRNH